ncbi:hypothetical protein [Clostridium sp. LIBA-8841]|uniref:hypothetical protein n=1 Tax=Clostridium sp. LIBA-8841 TaxID=2987530 RepID=UPI002AC667F0|nr:hypothetical protein [Clostridium sp. LIBA-8841]MDZ5254445.1 hypothetical protein [Clostridium sp. LIBA-8841]
MSLIKECTACKKRGIFLKLNNGLCIDCSNELKYLEHQYYYLESILRENLTVAEPNKIVEKANLILNNLEKFQNTYTSIEKDICLEVISLMNQQTQIPKDTSESEPISMNSIIYTDKNFDSSEIILETLPKDDLLEYENITKDEEDIHEDITHEIPENISPSLEEETNNVLNSDELPPSIVSDENLNEEPNSKNEDSAITSQSETIENSEETNQTEAPA